MRPTALLHPARRMAVAGFCGILPRNNANGPPHLLLPPARCLTASTSIESAARGGELSTSAGCGCAAHATASSLVGATAALSSSPPPPPGLATPTTSGADAAAATDHFFMGLALDQARAAAAEGEVPVGAVLVRTGPPLAAPGAPPPPSTPSTPFTPVVLAADRNRVEASNDATAHAEILVLKAASSAAASSPGAGSWRLGGTTLYVSLEPCAMCAGALLLARVDRLVYGAPNPAAGADGGWVGLLAAAKGGGGSGLARASADSGSDEDDDDTSTFTPHASHPSLVVTRGVRAEEAGGMLRQFFRARRAAAAAAKKAEAAMPPGAEEV